jgi:hypothetical protein
LVLLLVGLEVAARNPWVQSQLPPPSVNSRSIKFETNFAFADRLVAESGPLDCAIIGSSMAREDIDPLIMMNAYNAATGRSLRCFNFGIGGAVIEHFAVISKLVVERYHPKLIIYGVTARDFAFAPQTGAARLAQPDFILDVPWVRYKFGDFSVEGWLVDHCLACQYYLRLRQYANPDYARIVQAEGLDATPYGNFIYDGHVPFFVNGDLTPERKAALPIIFDFAPETRLQAVQELMDLRQAGVEVVLLELPYHPVYYYVFEGGAADYEKFLATVEPFVTAQDVPFWPKEEAPSLTAEGYTDGVHMNRDGAAIFSAWLGQRLAEAETESEIRRIGR